MIEDLKSLSDLIDETTSRKPILDFEYYKIYPIDGWHLWFEKSDGEGAQIRKDWFLVQLEKLFKEAM